MGQKRGRASVGKAKSLSAKASPKAVSNAVKSELDNVQIERSDSDSGESDSGLDEDDEMNFQESNKHTETSESESESESGSESGSEGESGSEDESTNGRVSSGKSDISNNASDSSSEGENGASSSGSEEESFPLKKKKKTADDGKATFANAFNAILGSKLKSYDRKDPILARNKGPLKKMESDKLEAKAKRLILNEKKELQDKNRVKNLLPSASEPEKVREALETERRLKKVAQKGVVKLFNAVLSTQIQSNTEISQQQVGQTSKKELMTEITKSKFLDLVKAAGDE